MRLAAVAVALSVAMIGGGCSGLFGDDGPKTRVVFEAVPAPGREVSEERLEEAAEIMRERADTLGLDATIESNEKQVAIEVPEDVADRVVSLLGRTARLEFFDLQGDLVSGVSIDAQGMPIARSKPPERRPNTVVVDCRPPTAYCPGVAGEPRRVSYYLFRDEPNLT